MKQKIIDSLNFIQSASRIELKRKEMDDIPHEKYINHTKLYIDVVQGFLEDMKEAIKELP